MKGSIVVSYSCRNCNENNTAFSFFELKRIVPFPSRDYCKCGGEVYLYERLTKAKGTIQFCFVCPSCKKNSTIPTFSGLPGDNIGGVTYDKNRCNFPEKITCSFCKSEFKIDC